MESLITIIIPTHKRTLYLQRSLKYWRNTTFKILIVDSSTQADVQIMPPNFKYLHMPGVPFSEKMANALLEVETEYTVFCADDDFLIESAINNCLKFLISNKDYVCAAGKTIAIKKCNNQLEFQEAYHGANSISDNNPIKRLSNHLGDYTFPTFYAITRTDVLEYSWRKTKENIPAEDYRFFELLPTLLTVMEGKFYISDELYSIRELIDTSTGAATKNIMDYKLEGTYDSYYQNFKNCLISELMKIENIDSKYAEKIIDDSMDRYIQKFFTSSVFLYKIRSQLYNILKKLRLYKFIRKIKRKNKNNNIIKYTNREEWSIIKKLLLE